MTEDKDIPRLTPPDERFPSREHLLRRPEDLSDEQFDLLAAAWAEDALGGEALAEMNQLLASLPSKMARAESFRHIRLTPSDERWSGTGRLLRRSVAVMTLRRSIIPALAAAAALIAFILSGPVTQRHTADRLPTQLHEVAVMNDVLIPAATPIIVDQRNTEVAVSTSRMLKTEKVTRQPVIAVNEIQHTVPLALAHNAASPGLIAALPAGDLAGMRLNTITTPAAQEKEANWIIKGVSLLARAVTKEEKKIDGYKIANACVNGINTVLGWDMELQQVSNRAGEPVKVNFSSSLLSFSAPLNKTAP